MNPVALSKPLITERVMLKDPEYSSSGEASRSLTSGDPTAACVVSCDIEGLVLEQRPT